MKGCYFNHREMGIICSCFLGNVLAEATKLASPACMNVSDIVRADHASKYGISQRKSRWRAVSSWRLPVRCCVRLVITEEVITGRF